MAAASATRSWSAVAVDSPAPYREAPGYQTIGCSYGRHIRCLIDSNGANPDRCPMNRDCADRIYVGDVHPLGTHLVTVEEITDFARQWDPMPMHIDPGAATEGSFNGVIGSGIHTLAIFQRLAVQSVYSRWNVVAGRRLRDVQFTAPLRPGSILSGTLTVISVLPPQRDASLVTVSGALRAGESTDLLTVEVDLYVAVRPSSESCGPPA